MAARAVAVTVALAALLAPAPARADGERTLLHAGIVVGGALGYLASETVFKEELAPSRCRRCTGNGLDRGVRDALVWDEPQTPDTISDVTVFGVAPALSFGLVLAASRDGDARLADGLAIAESVIVAGILNQTVKFAVGRQRPYAHVAGDGLSATLEDNLSFYSGHTTLGFTLAAASGTVAQMRGYRGAPWIWAGGVALASTAGYLRIAADRHWLSDVAIGAVIGTAVGIAVPRLAHRHLGDAPGATTPAVTLLSGAF